MSSSSITPTIGRKVWYWSNQDYSVVDLAQAFDATVVFIRADGTDGKQQYVDLMVTDHHGEMVFERAVPLLNPKPEDRHGAHRYATWMPYQVSVAKIG